MKQCFGYVRVSTQKQGEGVSLQAQRDAILAFASRQNLAVTRWFEEKETAAKSGRPVFNQMMKLLRRGAASGLIMHKIDRSARNLRDWAIISELPDAGIDVHIASESLDFRSRGGRLTADIQAVIAADYIRNLREETIKGLTGRLKQGLYPFRAPIGYRDAGRGKPKIPCPIKGPMVREAFLAYARGGHSLRSLQAELERLGLRNHAGQPLSLHGVETMLGNPFYCGLIYIRRTGATYGGIHEPLIEAATFARVQEVRARKAGKKVTRHDHTYRGLFRCGLCGAAMTPERQKGHVYYRCQRRGCDTKTIREDLLEVALQDALSRLQLTEADAETLQRDWLACMESDDKGAERRSLDLRIAQARDRLDRLTDLLVDGTLTKGDYHGRRHTLSLELARLQEERQKIAELHLAGDRLLAFLELMKTLAELHRLANRDEKRQLVENIFSNRTVSGRTVELEPCSWLRVKDLRDPSPLVTRRDTLLELRSREAIDHLPASMQKSPNTPKWKYNLKNQWLDDLQNAA